MTHLSIIPDWFFGYGMMFELAFAIITLAVCWYSFKIYKLSEDRNSKHLGYAFLFFSISYFVQFILNVAMFFELNEKILNIIELKDILTLDVFYILTHMILFTLGLVTLCYMVLKIKNKALYIFMMLFSILIILFSVNQIYIFYIFSSLLLLFITSYYLKNYIKNPNSKGVLMLIAFLFLLFGHLHFIFLMNHPVYYIIGSFLELVAYVLILINLLRVLRK
jgi:hypothetical protein